VRPRAVLGNHPPRDRSFLNRIGPDVVKVKATSKNAKFSSHNDRSPIDPPVRLNVGLLEQNVSRWRSGKEDGELPAVGFIAARKIVFLAQLAVRGLATICPICKDLGNNRLRFTREKQVPLALTTHWSGDVPVVVCRGRIVEGAESAALKEHLEKELAQQSTLLLDLSGVDFIDSSGLGLLVRVAMRAKKECGDLKLCCVSPRIQTALKTTKINTILKSYGSQAEALATFAPQPQTKKSAPIKADVLCVTASADLLAYLGQILHQSGYSVSTTDNLAEAETILAAAHPKFLVIDPYCSATVSGDPALRDRFNALIDGVSIVELPAGFATADAGDAGRQLLKYLRSALSAAQSGPSPE